MKITSKIPWLAVAALAVTASAHAAQGDLLAGFYGGGGNTYVLSIGSFSSLYNGEQWDVSSGLGSAGISASGASFGVVGYNPNNFSTVYLTKGGAPNPDLSLSDYGSIAGAIDSISFNAGVQPVNNGQPSEDWFTQTMNQYSPFTGNLIGALSGYNVNASQPGSATLLAEDQFTSSPSGLFLDFHLSSDGVLTYGVVPEPSTLAFAGIGLLLAVARRRIAKL